jgi:hypothetical protein
MRLSRMHFIKTIYVAHPYGNKAENKTEIENIIFQLQKKYPHYLFISPVHAFDFMYTKYCYEYGIVYCIGLMRLCDEVWAFGDIGTSRGMQTEELAADELEIDWVDGEAMLRD